MHSAVQVNQTRWTASGEFDPEQSRRSRRRMIDRLLEPDTIGFGIHFADAVFGHLRESAGRRVWEPAR